MYEMRLTFARKLPRDLLEREAFTARGGLCGWAVPMPDIVWHTTSVATARGGYCLCKCGDDGAVLRPLLDHEILRLRALYRADPALEHLAALAPIYLRREYWALCKWGSETGTGNHVIVSHRTLQCSICDPILTTTAQQLCNRLELPITSMRVRVAGTRSWRSSRGLTAMSPTGAWEPPAEGYKERKL